LFAGEQPQQLRQRGAWVTPEAIAPEPWLLSRSTGSASAEACGDARGRSGRLRPWPPTVAPLTHRAIECLLTAAVERSVNAGELADDRRPGNDPIGSLSQSRQSNTVDSTIRSQLRLSSIPAHWRRAS